jgi:hypothetical protein
MPTNLPSKEINVGFKTPGTTIHIISVENKNAVGRWGTRKLHQIQHIM